MFKKFALAAAAAAVVATAAPVSAQQTQTNDPFASTQVIGLSALPAGAGAAIVAGTFLIIAITAASDTD